MHNMIKAENANKIMLDNREKKISEAINYVVDEVANGIRKCLYDFKCVEREDYIMEGICEYCEAVGYKVIKESSGIRIVFITGCYSVEVLQRYVKAECDDIEARIISACEKGENNTLFMFHKHTPAYVKSEVINNIKINGYSVKDDIIDNELAYRIEW